MIYFFNWGSNSTTSICPSNCDPVLQWLSASTIRTSEAVVPRVNNVFSSSLEQFSANNAPGTYIFEVEGMGTTQINVGSSHTWGAIVGTGTFGIITASANIYDGSAKMD